MRQKANAWERRRVAYKVNCCCSLAGNKIFVERHLQSHFQAQCAFKVMRSTCPFSALPSPPPSLTLSLSLSSLCQAVVLVFIAYIFGVFFFVFLLLLLLLFCNASKAFTILWSHFSLYLPAHLEAAPNRGPRTAAGRDCAFANRRSLSRVKHVLSFKNS